jgi:hypothetical protein
MGKALGILSAFFCQRKYRPKLYVMTTKLYILLTVGLNQEIFGQLTGGARFCPPDCTGGKLNLAAEGMVEFCADSSSANRIQTIIGFDML